MPVKTSVKNFFPKPYIFGEVNYPVADSGTNSLQPSDVFRHKYLGRRIVAATLLRWG
jgi:hypothetical protein